MADKDPPPAHESPSNRDRDNIKETQAQTRERRGGSIDEDENNTSQDEKREIVRQLFGDVGELKRDFSCAVESSILLHGRMYVTKKFLCFYSNLFGLEKKIRVPYSHISVISKENTALVIPNAISVTTFRKEYIFRSFWDRDECYNLIKELVEAVKGTRGSTASSHEEANAASVIHATGPPPPKLETSSTSSSVTSGTSTAPPSSPPSALSQAQTQTPSQSASRPVSMKVGGGGVNGEEYETDSRARPVSMRVPMENPEEAYKLELEKSKLKNETAPVVMGGTIEEFFTKFIDDDAPMSYQKYQSETGDKDVEATRWADSDSSLGWTRDMRFLKPVAVPAMPFARALMIQRLQRFGDHALTIASSTRMEDVPYCDFFTVEVLVTVQATGEGELTVTTYYQVKFIQSTMFRRFIEGNTNPDVKKWNEDHCKYLKENMPEAKKGDHSRTRKRAATTKAEAPPSVPSPWMTAANDLLQKVGLGPLPSITGQAVFACAWGMVLVVFLFFAWQWRGVRSDLRAFDARLQQSSEDWSAAGRLEAMRGELGGVMQEVRDIQRRNEALVRMELLTGAGKGKERGSGVSLEQYLEGDAGGLQEGRNALLTTLHEEQPLLAERVLTLHQLNEVVRQLEGVLTSHPSSGGDSAVEGEVEKNE